MNTVTMLLTFALGATVAGHSDLPVERNCEISPPTATLPCWEAGMAEALELRLASRYKAAHRKYHAVARAQRAAGEFPGEALWQAAEVSHLQGKLVRAARELDQVAEHAREFGRPNLELRALFEAAYLHHRSGGNDLALIRLARVERLLTSPELSHDMRVMIATRYMTERAAV